MLYAVNPESYSRFDQRKTIFGRLQFDKKAPFYGKSMYENIPKILLNNLSGYSRIDFARGLASWTVYNYFQAAFSHEKLKNSNSVMEEPDLERYEVKDPVEMSFIVKHTAARFGADLAGITHIDKRWVYSNNYEGIPITIPQELKYAVVMAVAMDKEMIAASPSFTACIATGIGYSRMSLLVGCMAEFIRHLGYRAIPMGNDTALSIPLAIDAGLGELGRNGLLITQEFGSCVRICKLFTDLPLRLDRPKEIGLSNLCQRCRKCAESCKAEAISTEEQPIFSTVCPSNNPGIKRWPVNHDRCYAFWIENGGECSTCIAECLYTYQPYTPGGS